MKSEEVTLTVEGLSKDYGGALAVDDVSFDVMRGEFFSLLGPSGCGKTTTLRIIAGLVEPTSGRVRIQGRSMSGVAPHRRPISMVFQSYALFPHMTVEENVAFGLLMAKAAKATIPKTVRRYLEMVRMDGYEKRFPRELSGGQQQRVALARAAAISPAVLLLDEPLGALDRRLRDSMQVELRQLQRELNVATIMVTHDQDEALTLSDRMAIMRDGQIHQIATPTEIYERPVDSFVANFIGVSNLFDVMPVESRGDRLTLKTTAGTVVEAASKERWDMGSSLKVAIRPERIRAHPADAPDGHEAVVEHCVYLGRQASYHTRLTSGEPVIVSEQIQSEEARRFKEGERVKLSWSPADVRVLGA